MICTCNSQFCRIATNLMYVKGKLLHPPLCVNLNFSLFFQREMYTFPLPEGWVENVTRDSMLMPRNGDPPGTTVTATEGEFLRMRLERERQESNQANPDKPEETEHLLHRNIKAKISRCVTNPMDEECLTSSSSNPWFKKAVEKGIIISCCSSLQCSSAHARTCYTCIHGKACVVLSQSWINYKEEVVINHSPMLSVFIDLWICSLVFE